MSKLSFANFLHIFFLYQRFLFLSFSHSLTNYIINWEGNQEVTKCFYKMSTNSRQSLNDKSFVTLFSHNSFSHPSSSFLSFLFYSSVGYSFFFFCQACTFSIYTTDFFKHRRKMRFNNLRRPLFDTLFLF